VRKILYIVGVALVVTACGTPLQQGWYNFTAYYNTFFNAKQAYQEGLSLNERQQPALNPHEPIRVHRSPTRGGHEEFEVAIEKGASILRNHERSDYVPDAIDLIGKSYFYRMEYFSALEKFQELYQLTEGTDRQMAVVWEGRTYLEMELYDEGIRFVESELDYLTDWDRETQAEAYVVLAQLYGGLEDWEQVIDLLRDAAMRLSSDQMKVRSLFLLGQALEYTGNLYQSLAAYRLASETHSGYDLEFNSKRKVAELSRKTGDYDGAVRGYRMLERDDKFREYHTEMAFEVARTYQLSGYPDMAVSQYNRILGNRLEQPDNVVRSKVYFSLGEIFRDYKDDFGMAAAYFDSAASGGADLSLYFEDQNAREMARAFSDYARLKNEISKRDSLLHLASLSPAELEITLEQIALQHQAEQDELIDDRGGILAEDADLTEASDAAEVTRDGFLNIHNRERLQEASIRFRAIWGDRPLADNWRRHRAAGGVRLEPIAVTETDGALELEADIPTSEPVTTPAGVDLTNIPFSEAEQANMNEEIEELKYRLGNLFFLSLNMPDSAAVYYREIAQSGNNDQVRPRAIYSLAEIEFSRQNEAEAEHWAGLLLAEYPNEEVAIRISRRLGWDVQMPGRSQDFRIGYRQFSEEYSDTSRTAKAERLVELARDAESDQQKAQLLLEAAQNYILDARETERSQPLDDTARVDDFPAQPDESLTFIGESWDLARELLTEIAGLQSDPQLIRRAELLLKAIEPVEKDPEFIIDRFPEEMYPVDPAGELDVCRESGLSSNFDGRFDELLERLSLSQQELNLLPDIIEYRMVIEPDGFIASFELLTREVPGQIQERIDLAIEEYLEFESFEGTYSARCKIVIPVR
jgi:tetratricopeptide (TPR) repeat protein/TolA-binding protein